MPEPSDSNDVQAIMQNMLAENAKAAEALIAGAQQARDEAAQDRKVAQQALAETEQSKEALFAAFYEEHCNRIEKDLRDQLNRSFILALLQNGEPPEAVAALLDVPEAQTLAMAQHFGYVKWENEKFETSMSEQKTNTSSARVSYENQGRGGYVILQIGEQTCRFWYEFGGGNALAIIDVPSAEHWENLTTIPLNQREKILHFIGESVVADKAPGHYYRIDATSIVILID